jgi:hypothetical protein
VEAWLAALRAGRTFITNGPLLDFRVEGRRAGETVALASARGVRVEGRARGRLDFGLLEVVRNGEVIGQADARPSHGHFEAALRASVPLSTPSWLALRVSGGRANEYGRPIFGHTSPVYITLSGRAIRMEQEVQYLIGEIRRAMAAIDRHARFLGDADRPRVLGVYRRALTALEEGGQRDPNSSRPASNHRQKDRSAHP